MDYDIEKDIKDLENYISFSRKHENFSNDTEWNFHKETANKIEHILLDYKKLQEEFKQVDHECDRLEQKELKLEKENEEYKKQLDLDYVDNNYISIQIIKGKIEALDVLITNLGYDEDAPDEYKNDIDREIFLLTRDKRILQELIGEE